MLLAYFFALLQVVVIEVVISEHLSRIVPPLGLRFSQIVVHGIELKPVFSAPRDSFIQQLALSHRPENDSHTILPLPDKPVDDRRFR